MANVNALKCSLNSKQDDYLPHTKVEKDLNGDGINDFFYLAGEEDVYQTCIFLSTKSKTKLYLAHSHSDFYDTVFSFDGSNTAQILVPSDINKACSQADNRNSFNLISDSLKSDIKKSYAQWSKGYEAYNFTYNMPDFYPVHNLFLLNEVKIYKFAGKRKIDVTKKMTSYLELKRKVLEAAIKQDDLSKKCKKHLSKTLKRIQL